MKIKKHHRWLVGITCAITFIAVVQVARHFFREEERLARIRMRQAIMAEFPEAVRTLQTAYGLRPFDPSPGQNDDGAAGSTVILVHGIDDPGRVWMNLAPALTMEGFTVWILIYPNDQPVAESARFFMNELSATASDLRPSGRIDIVAHSMGGLVTREMLTDPALDFDGKTARGELPVVERFIMVGTPNHGAELARFRGFLEVRDQWGNLLKDDYHWLQGIVDGAGEAGIDLLPGSEFLQRLNSRPHPADVRMLVIAGVMSPKQKQEIKTLARHLEDKLPDATRNATRRMADGLVTMTEQVGDGLVSVNSARLPGVPLMTVRGTHLSMIRNLTPASRRMPPAISIILEKIKPSTVSN